MGLIKESAEELDEIGEIENSKKVEAALFIAGRFLSVKDLVALSDVNPILLRKILGDLEDKYKNSGVTIIKKGEMWKMDVSADYKDIVNRLATGKSEFSRAEQETLAIIAYKQPIKQSVIIKIRGNKGYDHIRRFVETGLLNKKKMGHTSELTLTENFYDYFNVGAGDNLEEVAEALDENGNIEEINKKVEIAEKEVMEEEKKGIANSEEENAEEKEGDEINSEGEEAQSTESAGN